jgi:hypothetical protein
MDEKEIDKNDPPPTLRVESKSGAAYYPRYHKNTEGEWELNDKSFRNLLKPHLTSEKPVKTDKD